jgi:ribosomal-protein-alanine N-acetyltransferase
VSPATDPDARQTSGVQRADLRLRPFDEPDLAMCDRIVTDPAFGGPFEWVGFRSGLAYRRRWEEDRLLGASPYHLVVAAADDAAIGFVDWRDTERAGPGVFEIGVVIVPEMRGRRAGTIAQSLLVDYLFATTTVHRIWAGTEVGNIAEQRALERCGFRQEGRLRGHHFRDGQWRDSFVYGLTRDEDASRPRP